ncbi:MAG: hypothetical protein V1694_08025 [Candidatus Eisenbacteria bacterium]
MTPFKEGYGPNPSTRPYANVIATLDSEDYDCITVPIEPSEIIAFPNPCRLAEVGSVQLANIPEDRTAVVRIYDVSGHLVRTLRFDEGISDGGANEGFVAAWDGNTDGGRKASYGVYVYIVECSGRSRKGTFALIR